MKLTGKCEIDFKKYYNTLDISVEIPIQVFLYGIPPSMQYGVYVDFFDSVGIYMSVEVGWSMQKNEYDGYDYVIHGNYLGTCDTLQEARTKAIEKAVENYNQTK